MREKVGGLVPNPPKYHFILILGIASADDFMDPLGKMLQANGYGDYEHVNLFTGGILYSRQ